MIATEQHIEQFLADHSVTGTIKRIICPSECWADTSHCFQVTASSPGNAHIFYVYTGPGWNSIDLVHAIRHLVELAEENGGFPTFEDWKREDDGYLIGELGESVCRAYYEDSVRAQDGLIALLGEEDFEELSRMIMGG